MSISRMEQAAIEYGAIRLDETGTPVVTLQKNPNWDDTWDGDRHYQFVTTERGKISRRTPKYIPALMRRFQAKLAAEELNRQSLEALKEM